MSTITRAKLLRGDLNLYNGKDATATRLDATGGTVTGRRVGDTVDVAEVYGSGAKTSASINTAITQIGSSAATLSFAPGTWAITANVTVPANMACHVPGGCVFSIDSGITLTFSGPVHVDYSATDGTGWYTGDGTITCSQGAAGFPGW